MKYKIKMERYFFIKKHILLVLLVLRIVLRILNVYEKKSVIDFVLPVYVLLHCNVIIHQKFLTAEKKRAAKK